MKKILVTGAAGYIGAHLVKALADRGYLVHALDYNFNQNDILKYISKIIEWDICEPIPRKFSDSYDAVFHLAAQTMVERSTRIPSLYYLTNTIGTMHVCDAFKTDNFIFGSTGCAIAAGKSPYATSKRAAEDVVAERQAGYSICRFFNVSGNNGFRKYDDSYYHLIRRVAAAHAGRFDSIPIFGTDFDTPDGTAIRNYTHIADIVDAMITIMEHGPTNAIENLGNVDGYSVKQVIHAMEQVTGFSIPTVVMPRRNGDIDKTSFDTMSRFFKECHSLEQQCESSLVFEMSLIKK